MLDELYRLIKENESPKEFTYTPVTDEMIASAEGTLGLRLPEEYKWFLKTFGQG